MNVDKNLIQLNQPKFEYQINQQSHFHVNELISTENKNVYFQFNPPSDKIMCNFFNNEYRNYNYFSLITPYNHFPRIPDPPNIGVAKNNQPSNNLDIKIDFYEKYTGKLTICID